MRPKARKSRGRKLKTARQLTIRGYGDEIDHAIREEARAEGVSLNQAVLRLVAKGVGLTEKKKPIGKVGHSLDHFAGTWTEEEAREFDRIIEEGCESIDAESWK